MTLALVNADPTTTVVDVDTSSHVIDLPGSLVEGDFLFLITVFTNAASFVGLSDKRWADNAQFLDDGLTTMRLAYVRIDADMTSDTTVTMTTSGNVESCTHVFHMRGGNLEVNTPVFEFDSSGTGTTSPDPPSLTSPYGAVEHLWIAAVAHSNTGSTSAAPSGYTNLASSEGGNSDSHGLASAHRTATTATEDPGSFTWGTSRAPIMITIGIPTAEVSTPVGDYPTPTRRYSFTNGGGAATIVVPFPADLTGFGSVLIIESYLSDLATPSGWTLLGNVEHANSDFSVFYRMGGGGDITISVTDSHEVVAWVYIFDDVDFSTDPPVLATDTVSPADATVDPPEVTMDDGDYMVICGSGTTAAAWPVSAISDYPNQWGRRSEASDDVMVVTQNKYVSGTSEDPGTYDLNTGRQSVEYTLAVPGVESTPPPTPPADGTPVLVSAQVRMRNR